MNSACRDVALEESLWGTAPQGVKRWLLVEYASAWGRKVLEPPCDLPASTLAFLSALRDIRIQYIRKPGVLTQAGSVFFVASDRAHILRFELSDYAELEHLDVEQVFRDWTHPKAQPVERPLILVCGHGQRDRCCALHGVKFYQSLAALHPNVELWQTSHLGGHRFSAVAFTFPGSFYYGRLQPEQAEEFIAALLAQKVFAVEHLRGRCTSPAPAQAAECFLRDHLSAFGYDDLELENTVLEREDSWLLSYKHGEQKHQVRVQQEALGMRMLSCGAEPEAAYSYRCSLD